ncbi:MAG: hypothetical protein WCR52_07940 [Bacteroidota bacterium]
MKPLFLLLFLLPGAQALLYGQTTTIQQNFLLTQASVESPLDRSHATEAGNILASMLAQSAASSGSKYSVFSLQPNLSLLEEGKIEGVKTLITAKVNAGIRVTNVISSETLGAFDLVLTGSGKTRAEAITKAIQQLRNKKGQFVTELNGFEQKIKTYYEKNCDAIIAKAQDQLSKKEFASALAMLHGIPSEAACAQTAAALTAEAFTKVQEQQCSAVTRQADAFVAANNFVAALQVLSQIDPAAPCAADASAKIAAIETKVDAAQKEQWEWLFKFWSAGADAEKARWNALTAISLGWLRSNSKLEFIER